MEYGSSALSEIEQRFRDTMQGAPVGIIIFRGEQLIVEMASDKYLQLIDRTLDQLIGRPFFETVPEVREAVEPLLRGVLTTGVPYHGNEFPVTLNRHGHSDLSYFNFVYQPVKEKDGKVTGIVVIAIEVTEFIISREKLAQRESHFRNLVMNSPVAMTIFQGFDHRIELANHIMFDNIWHKKREDVIGKRALDVFPELKTQKYPELLHRVMTTGATHTEKEAVAFVQGDDILRKMYLDFTYAPIFDANSTPYGVIITVIDVSEKVKAREQLAKAEKTSRLAIQSAKLGTYEADLVNDEVITSDRFNVLWGIKPPVTRVTLLDAIHPEDRPGRDQSMANALVTGSLEYETRVVWPDQSEHWVSVRGMVLYDADRKPMRVIGVVQDIEDQKSFASKMQRQVQERTEELQTVNEEIAATNEELSESNQLLVDANKDLEQFNYAASHDLQEPLRKIQTFTNILLEDDKIRIGDSDKDYLVKINNSAIRMKSIIDDLLSYSHNTMKDQDQEEVDLNRVIHDVSDDLEVVIKTKGGVIKSQSLPVVNVISTQMHQLFLNLISNALKFSRPGVPPVVTITTSLISNEVLEKFQSIGHRREYFQIVVSDNGIGFSEKYNDYIFGLFKRLHTKSTYSGTGIGLTLCRKIARNHHGDVFADSTEGVGTDIIVVLPVSIIKKNP